MKQSLLWLLLTLGIVVGCASNEPVRLGDFLSERSWQLVKFTGRDGTVRMPDDQTKYTIAFKNDGKMHVRFDCESGGGTCTSTGPNQLVFGPPALSRLFGATRRECSPESLHDQLVRHWPLIRSFTLDEGGRLLLSAMDDGGTYYFETIKPFWQFPYPVSH